MSRLLDILNPALPTEPANATPLPPSLDALEGTPQDPSEGHQHVPSLSSPLGALAIGANTLATGAVVQSSVFVDESRPYPMAETSLRSDARTMTPTTLPTQELPPGQIDEGHRGSSVVELPLNGLPKDPMRRTPSNNSNAPGPAREGLPDHLGSSEPLAGSIVQTEREEPLDAIQKSIPSATVERAGDLQDSIAETTIEREESVASTAVQATKNPRPAAKRKSLANTLKKPTSKKRKVDADSKDGTPFSQRSMTPASSRASRAPPSKGAKHTPNYGSPAPSGRRSHTGEDELDDGDEDETLFCTCRKPDDHTYMIGCDGGCEDWFHGRCVNINEKNGKLVDKYICPNCELAGVGHTTWKAMCRLDACREPARVTSKPPSKYCSDEHGEQFFAQRLLPTEKNASHGMRKRQEDQHTAIGREDEESDDQAYLRGGVLRASELKSLRNGVHSLKEFQRLGEGVVTPADDGAVRTNSRDAATAHIRFSSDEQTQLEEIRSKVSSLRRALDRLDSKEVFLALVRARAKSIVEELKQKENVKDICGFDARLSWSDVEFDAWLHSSEGHQALEEGALQGPPTTSIKADADVKMSNGVEVEREDPMSRGVCSKKRCERHKLWYKLQQQDIAFEREECSVAMSKLERQEKGISERATLRFLDAGNDGLDDTDMDGLTTG